MQPRPPLTPGLWLSYGYLGGQWVAPWTSGWALPAAAVTAGVALLLRAPRSDVARVIALTAAVAAVGHCQLDARLQPRLPPSHVASIAAADAVLRGTVDGAPTRRPSGWRMVLRVDGVRRGGAWRDSTGRILLTVGAVTREWERGDRMVARVRMRAPRNFGNPDEFDYEQFLARRAIYATSYAHSDRDWQRLPRRQRRGWTDLVRRRAIAALEQVAPVHLRPVAEALLLGGGAAIPSDIREKYARAGVSHVLAISGLHIGLVAAAAFGTCRWLLGRSEYLLVTASVPKLATLASLPPSLAYAAIAGSSAATLRAAITIALFLSALLLDRPRHWASVIAMAAAAVCCASPGALFEASFQLSFGAVAAIVAGGPPLRDAYDAWAERRLLRLYAPRRHAIERWLVLSQSVTVLALLATAPLTLHHFQQFSVVGLVSNLFVVPVTGMAAVSVGLAAVLVTPILPGLGAVLFAACCGFLALGDALVDFFSALPGSSVHLPTPGWAEIAVYHVLLASLLARRARWRAAVTTVVVLAGALQWASWAAERGGDELRLTFVSVGQGDCTLVEYPGGHVMLIDGGGLSATFDVGERILAPLLLRRKIRTVDTVLLTHPDYDHYGGLAYVAERFGPVELWTNGSRGRGQRYEEFRRRMERSGARAVVVRRGFERTIGGVAVRVLHPSADRVEPSNDASVVVHLSFGAMRVLLTGDVERVGEAALARRGVDLRSAILKVPHHGSRTSSSDLLLDAVRPAIAVVSNGYRNRYDMPHRSIVERYRRRGVDMLRTDLDGAIEIRVAPSGAIELTRGRRWRRQRWLQIDPDGEVRGRMPRSWSPFAPSSPAA
jgi:competence protein ComEC